jgi:hypothetical protein
MIGLTLGNYRFYCGVDVEMRRQLDQDSLCFDSLQLSVTVT